MISSYSMRGVLLPLMLVASLLVSGCERGAHPADYSEYAYSDLVVDIYMPPLCGCCGAWISHAQSFGIEVRAHDVSDMGTMREELGLPREMLSCHTSVVEGYIVEGHVHAQEILRLVRDSPDIQGIAVPGMPIGSPGMEGEDAVEYDVLAFEKDGSVEVFATYDASGVRVYPPRLAP